MTETVNGVAKIFGFGLLLLSGGGCMDYGLSGLPEGMKISEFEDCTSVVGDRYWYEDHTFSVVMLYDGCDPDPEQIGAYLLIEHEFEDMNWAWTTASYTTNNGDEITVDAVYFSLELWYNPVDLELMVVPYEGHHALGLHEFWIDCDDDNDTRCDLDYLQGVDSDDLE